MCNNIKNKYFAFISYKREDEEWAVWFHHELENYHLPATLNGRSDLPTEFRPVFRDIDELKAGNLPEQIYNALATSAYLIVICSPNSAKSKWVNKEIRDFIEIGKSKNIDNVRNIFPFIVDGRPHSQNGAEECFPQALRDLSEEHEQVGGNVNESGRDKAFVKVLAGMLPNVAFDELWNRYERDKAEEERKKREEMDRTLISQSRLVAEKAISLAKEDSYFSRLLALDVLPKDLENPNRPYTAEAEKALRNACFLNNTKLKGHSDDVYYATFSPDGKQIASASCDKTIRIWNVIDGSVLKVLKGHLDWVRFVAYSPDGKRIVSSSDDKTIKIWDVDSGKELLTMTGHKERVNTVVFDGEGVKILSSSNDNTAIVWDAVSGKSLMVLSGHEAGINTAFYSPDGKWIVTASDDGTIRIWDTDNGEQKIILKGHTNNVFCATFSPDSKMIASGSADETIRMWDFCSQKEIKELNGHSGIVFSVSFDSKGQRIVSSYWDNTIKIWNVSTGEKIGELIGHSRVTRSAFFSSDDKRIVSSSKDKTIRIWDVDDKKEKLMLRDGSIHINHVGFSPDGKWFVSASKKISLWDANSGQLAYSYKGDSV